MAEQQHADAIIDVMSAYAHQGSNLCLGALAGASKFQEWRHYPFNDAIDAAHHTEFYYHAHAAHERAPNEHGHFHVFVRRGHAFHHLIGISLSPTGWPTRLFLTNRWVTDEHWASWRTLAPLLARFQCQVSGRLAPVSRWITAMVQVYAKDIQSLHQQREKWLATRAKTPTQRAALLENRHFQVIAEQPISLDSLLRETLNAA